MPSKAATTGQASWEPWARGRQAQQTRVVFSSLGAVRHLHEALDEDFVRVHEVLFDEGGYKHVAAHVAVFSQP